MTKRSDAGNRLCEYTQSESLRKHALAVEACVRAYARKLGGDEEIWALAGLLHDFDYERWPNADHHPTEEHPYAGSLILRERGYPEEIITAILSHANYSGVPRVSPLDKTLFAGRLPDGLCAHQAHEEHPRSRTRLSEEKTEGQSIRPGRQS